ncbi:hypothetical protein CMALT430_170108 [Carnobacterium maltaromaticum]|nr:hypothetical protein CMALT430_170108 [Carnobacterium maltaromaticum]
MQKENIVVIYYFFLRINAKKANRYYFYSFFIRFFCYNENYILSYKMVRM